MLEGAEITAQRKNVCPACARPQIQSPALQRQRNGSSDLHFSPLERFLDLRQELEEDFAFQILLGGEPSNLTYMPALQMPCVTPMAFRNDFKMIIIIKKILICAFFEREG